MPPRSHPIVLLLASAAVLTGCASGTPTDASSGSGAPTAAATAEPTPTPTTEPTPADPTALLIGPTEMASVDSEGQPIERLTYDLPIDELISRLAETFGAAPTEERFEPGDSDLGAATDFVWGGFRVMDFDDDADGDYAILVEESTVGTLPITTADGLSVGDPIGDAVELHPDFVQYSQGAIGILVQSDGPFVALLFDERREFDPAVPIRAIRVPATTVGAGEG